MLYSNPIDYFIFNSMYTLIPNYKCVRPPHVSPTLSNHKSAFEVCESIQFSCSVVSHPATPWTTALQAYLSITNSQSPSKPMFTKSVMPSSHLIFCCHLLLLPSIFPSIRVFSNESALPIRCQSIRVSVSTSILPMNTQNWSSLGWTGWISLQSKGLSRVFSNTTVQKH